MLSSKAIKSLEERKGDIQRSLNILSITDPIESLEERKSAVKLYSTLRSLSALPYEAQLSILLNLDPMLLEALCDELTVLPESSELKGLETYCSDWRFWVSYLKGQGYLLPEKLPDLIEILRQPEEIPVEVLKALFLNRIRFNYSNSQTMLKNRLIDQWEREFPLTGPAPTGQLRQAILDLAYLFDQFDIRIGARFNKRPMIWIIWIKGTDSLIERLDQTRRMEVNGLFEMIVDTDSKIAPYENNLFPWWIEKEFPYYKPKSEDHALFFDEIREQTLVLIGDLLEQGDIIILKIVSKADRDYSYFFDGRILIKMKLIEGEEPGLESFLPREALPFLRARGILNLKQLRAYYELPRYLKLIGVADPQRNKILRHWE
jgi:hypothetical protein